MWSRAFWAALAERVIRGGAAAVVGGWAADGVFNVMEVQTWRDVLSLFAGGAVFSAAASLAGNAITKTGPSFNNAETTAAAPPPQHAPD